MFGPLEISHVLLYRNMHVDNLKITYTHANILNTQKKFGKAHKKATHFNVIDSRIIKT